MRSIGEEQSSSYTDIKNNTRKVKHSIAVSCENKTEHEERIISELYAVFTHRLN